MKNDPMKRTHRFLLAMALAVPFSAAAHKQWLLPSSTVVAGQDPWITVDAAVSNQLYYPDHVPMRLDGIVITAPDGSTLAPQNGATGRYRSVFDVNLKQEGTYRIANVNAGLSARWGERPAGGPGPGGMSPPKDGKAPTAMPPGGPQNSPNGGFLRNVSVEELATKIPKGAKNVEVSETASRVETFVTNGTPTPVTPTGKGLELVPVTHPNDLFAGEQATFKLLVDGKPQAGLEVQVIRGATRYRNAQDEIKATTDADGQFSVTWPEPGMYWLSTSTSDSKTSVPQAKQRRLGYVATLEVLPQ